jgi:hypothetical protein
MTGSTEPALTDLARGAVAGDRAALTTLVGRIQHPLYRVSLRFLGHPQDAEDATQEILIRVITRLGTFEGRSELMTWAHGVAIRMLLRTRMRLAESSVRGADAFAEVVLTRLGGSSGFVVKSMRVAGAPSAAAPDLARARLGRAPVAGAGRPWRGRTWPA